MMNSGYSYAEQLGPQVRGRNLLGYLTAHYPHSDEATWRRRLAAGEVLLEGVAASGAERLQAGQRLVWNRPPWQEEEVPHRYEVVYEDTALLAVHKPSGLPTLPGGGFLANTLLTFVRQTHPEVSPLHRLGRATSGLVLFARTPEAARAVSTIWRRGVTKTYRALGAGVAPLERYTVSTPIGPVPHPRLGTVFAASAAGKAARSCARVLERRPGSTLFEVTLDTGRPHQIRIHLAATGYPLVGDPVYAAGGGLLPEPGLPGDGGYLLHAERLRFEHPFSGAGLELRAPPPQALRLDAD